MKKDMYFISIHLHHFLTSMFSHPWFNHSNRLKTINVRSDFKSSEQAPDMNFLGADNMNWFYGHDKSPPRTNSFNALCSNNKLLDLSMGICANCNQSDEDIRVSLQ